MSLSRASWISCAQAGISSRFSRQTMVTFFAAQPLGGERHVDGHVAAAHHQNVLADFDFLAQGGIPQEIHPLQHARDILVFDPKTAAAVQADGQEHGLEAVLLEAVEGDVLAEGDPGRNRDAHAPDDLNLEVQDVPRQAVGGNTHGHHAAGHRQLLENGHLVAALGQVVGCRQAGRP